MFLFPLVLFLLAGTATAQTVKEKVITVTPTITADAYADGDQMGTTFSIPGTGNNFELYNLVVIDKADVKDAFNILLFASAIAPTSADNAAVSVTDAIMASSYLGRISVAAADFVSTGANADAVKEVRRVMQVDGINLYGLLVCKDAGGCDYASTTDLVLKFAVRE